MQAANIIKLMILEVKAEMSTSENHSRDFFEYGKSHVAHMATGFLSCALLSAAWFAVDGEFPIKTYMAAFLVVFWALYEYKTQPQGTFWGNFEDWVFLGPFGAVPAALLFSEVSIGSPILNVNIEHAGPVYAASIGWLLTGAITRLYLKVKDHA